MSGHTPAELVRSKVQCDATASTSAPLHKIARAAVSRDVAVAGEGSNGKPDAPTGAAAASVVECVAAIGGEKAIQSQRTTDRDFDRATAHPTERAGG